MSVIKDPVPIAGAPQLWIALLGHRDTPVDGVEDYCTFVGRTLAERDVELQISRVPWAAQGWIAALRQLHLDCKKWAGH